MVRRITKLITIESLVFLVMLTISIIFSEKSYVNNFTDSFNKDQVIDVNIGVFAQSKKNITYVTPTVTEIEPTIESKESDLDSNQNVVQPNDMTLEQVTPIITPSVEEISE